MDDFADIFVILPEGVYIFVADPDISDTFGYCFLALPFYFVPRTGEHRSTSTLEYLL